MPFEHGTGAKSLLVVTTRRQTQWRRVAFVWACCDLSLGQYAGLVTQLDEAMRQIVEVSKRRGMWENTLLWAFADNGADISHGASNWPFRGSKGTSCSRPRTHTDNCPAPAVSCGAVLMPV